MCGGERLECVHTQVPTVYVNMIDYYNSVKDAAQQEAMREGAAALRLMVRGSGVVALPDRRHRSAGVAVGVSGVWLCCTAHHCPKSLEGDHGACAAGAVRVLCECVPAASASLLATSVGVCECCGCADMA